MTQRPYHPRKQPSQQRSRQMVDDITEGAIRIFGRDGYAGATVPSIAACAGVSVGSLYQYFPNKLALLAAAKKRHFAAVFAELEEILMASPDLHSGLGAAVAHYLRRCHASRTLLRHFAEELPARTFGEENQTPPHVRILRCFFEKHRTELPGRDPGQAALIIGELVNSTSLASIRTSPENLADGVLERGLLEAISAYLR